MSAPGSLFVEASARLHFGVLDLRGVSRAAIRWAWGPRYRSRRCGSRCPAPSESPPQGEDSDRAAEFARRFLTYHGLPGGAHLMVHRAIPAHSGLGSGTQLGLAVARALAELFTDCRRIRRSWPGRSHGASAQPSVPGHSPAAASSWRVDGARGRTRSRRCWCACRSPADWRCVVASRRGEPGLSGDAESAAFGDSVHRLSPKSSGSRTSC